MSAFSGATEALVGFLAQRSLADRQAMLDELAGADRARTIAREDSRDARGDREEEAKLRAEEARLAERAAAAKKEQAALERQATVQGLTGQRQASLNLVGTGDPTGAQATRNAIAVALRLAGGGDVADAGLKDDAATAAAARAAAVDAAKPPKRDIRQVGDALVEVPVDGPVQPLYRAPAKGPSEATQLAAEMRQLQLDERRGKIADAATEKAAKADEARAITTDTLSGVRGLLKHPGLGASQGVFDSRVTANISQPAQDFRAERDRIVAALTLPNLGALKGPMSDKDVAFVKQLASKLASDTMSDTATVQELKRLETFLESKLGGRRGGDDLGKDWD